MVAAIQAGNVDTVKLLLEKGVDVNTPLIYQEFVLVGTEKVCAIFGINLFFTINHLLFANYFEYLIFNFGDIATKAIF